MNEPSPEIRLSNIRLKNNLIRKEDGESFLQSLLRPSLHIIRNKQISSARRAEKAGLFAIFALSAAVLATVLLWKNPGQSAPSGSKHAKHFSAKPDNNAQNDDWLEKDFRPDEHLKKVIDHYLNIMKSGDDGAKQRAFSALAAIGAPEQEAIFKSFGQNEQLLKEMKQAFERPVDISAGVKFARKTLEKSSLEPKQELAPAISEYLCEKADEKKSFEAETQLRGEGFAALALLANEADKGSLDDKIRAKALLRDLTMNVLEDKDSAVITLLSARDSGDYDKSSYSFRHVSQDPAETKRGIDILFDNAFGNFKNSIYVRMHGGQENIVALSPSSNWADFSETDTSIFEERISKQQVYLKEGEVYLQRVKCGDFDFMVKFQVQKLIPAKELTLRWKILPGGKNAPKSTHEANPATLGDGMNGKMGGIWKDD